MGSLLPESIDVAAGIVFVYLFMSILATIGREAFEGFMKRRARNLEKGLMELLCDHPPENSKSGKSAYAGFDILKAFYDHPLIMSLYRGRYAVPGKRTFAQGRTLPSYIPPSHFAYVVLDVLAETGGQTSSGQLDTQTILTAANSLNNRRLAKMVQFAINNSGGDIDKARQFMEAWFNATMDRVSGWYRLETQTILFWISLVACVVLNVNTVVIADSLWRSPSLRKTLEVQAEAYYNGKPSAMDSLQPPVTTVPTAAGSVASTAADEVPTAGAVPMPPATPPVTAVPVPTTQANPPPAATLVTNGDIPGLLNATDPLEKLGLPLGWNSQTITAMHRLFPQAPRVSVAEAQAMQKAEKSVVTGANPVEWTKNLFAKIKMLWDSTVDAYDSNNQDPAKNALFHAAGTLSLIMGWVMTAFAVTLGAPFWFDILSKLMMVRSTMKPGDKGSSSVINLGAIAASLTSSPDTGRVAAATASYLPDFSTVGGDAASDGDLTNTLDPNSRPRDP